MSRVLLACVGNLLRRDDGFGPAVAARLRPDALPPGAELLETGIGGMALLQELLAGCDGLVLIDAVSRGAPAGSVFVIEPEVGEAEQVADLHLANPERVLTMAKAMGALPERVRIVGCEPADADELGDHLSPQVARGVEVAAERARAIAEEWTEELS